MTVWPAPTTLAGGEAAVELTWGQAIDEAGGEQDVVRYVPWRRDTGMSDWGASQVALPAGAGTSTATSTC